MTPSRARVVVRPVTGGSSSPPRLASRDPSLATAACAVGEFFSFLYYSIFGCNLVSRAGLTTTM